MKPRCPATLTALLGLWVSLGARTAVAAERACPAMTVEVDAGLRARWPELLPHVRSELAALDDLDTCAHIELSLIEDAAIGVEVTLPDGRTATRTAALREDVMPTLQALLLVPEPTRAVTDTPAPPTPEGASKARPRPTARGSLHALSASSERGASGAGGTRESRALGIELSLISGARIGDGQTSFGLGALSFLEVHGWLLGAEARADRYQSLSGDSQEAAMELALLLGRRLQFPGVALDLCAGPAIAEKGFGTADTHAVSAGAAARPEPPPEPSSGAVPRLLVGSRLGLSPRSVLRTFIGIDGELGPARASSQIDRRTPSLPVWTVGLALGATLGTR